MIAPKRHQWVSLTVGGERRVCRFVSAVRQKADGAPYWYVDQGAYAHRDDIWLPRDAITDWSPASRPRFRAGVRVGDCLHWIGRYESPEAAEQRGGVIARALRLPLVIDEATS